MIIVEGSDMVGKTTFCRSLVTAINFSERRNRDERFPPFVHSSHLSALPPKWNFVNDYLMNRRANEVTVWDRYHISELMYREFHSDNTPKLTLSKYMRVDEGLRSFGALIVVITADPDMLQNRLLNDPREEMFSPETIAAVNKKYIDFCTAPDHPFADVTTCEVIRVHCDVDQPFPSDAFVTACADKFLDRWLP